MCLVRSAQTEEIKLAIHQENQTAVQDRESGQKLEDKGKGNVIFDGQKTTAQGKKQIGISLMQAFAGCTSLSSLQMTMCFHMMSQKKTTKKTMQTTEPFHFNSLWKRQIFFLFRPCTDHKV